MQDYKNKMKIQELIDKLNELGKNKRVSLASNESMDIVYDEICVERLNDKIVLFPLDDSADF